MHSPERAPSHALITLLHHERQALASLASGQPLGDVLQSLALDIEATVPGGVVSILLLSEDGMRLRHGAAPSLPPSYSAAVDGLELGPDSGSCSTAVFRNGKPVYVSDIATDPLWADYRELAALHALKACWSMPMQAVDGRLIGTFALYFRQPREAAEPMVGLLAVMAHAAALVIERHGMDRALRESEDHYRHAVNLNPQVAWTAHPDGTLDYIGERWKLWTGLGGLGTGWLDAVHPDDAECSARTWNAACRTAEPYDIEHRVRWIDGRFHWMRSRAFVRRDACGRVLKWYGSTEDIHDRWQAAQSLRERESQLRELNSTLEDQVRVRTDELTVLTRHLQSTQEEERSRLARELHDELGAIFTTAKMDAVRLKARLGNLPPEAELRMAHMIATLNLGVELKRRIIEDLRPSALTNLGLVQALQILSSEFSHSAGLSVQCRVENIRLTPSAQLAIYRLVQEALTNIAKHARATKVQVQLEKLGTTQAHVRVTDDGVGFDGIVRRGSAHGLSGIRYRVEAERGVFSIQSADRQGTRVSALLPVAHALGESDLSRPAPLM